MESTVGHRQRLFLAVLVACVVAMSCNTGPAHASGLVIPPWVPAPTGSLFNQETTAATFSLPSAPQLTGSSSVQSLSVQGVSNRLKCGPAAWNAIQQDVNRLVIGNCFAGEYLNATKLGYDPSTPPNQDPYFYGGYIADAFDSCGWVNNGRLNYISYSNPTPNTCTNPTKLKPEFVYCMSGPGTCPMDQSGYNLAIWTDSSGNDGVWVDNVRACTEYYNYRPWSSNNAPRDPASVTIAAHATVRLRYVTRFQYTGTAYTAGYYAMIHDGTRWAFVPWSCITG